MNQTDQQVFIVVREWLAHHAPPDFIDSPANGHALFNYILEFLGETVTLQTLSFAEQTLRSQGRLQLAAPPPQPTPEEVAAVARKKAEEDAKNQIVEQQERWKKQHYDALNQKPRNFAKEVLDKKKADEIAKGQAAAEAAIKREIAGYVCIRRNTVDHSATEQIQAYLAGIEVRVDGKRCAVRTLEKIREKMRELP